MIFFPYKADFSLNYIPFFTIIICIVCPIIYYAQESNEKTVRKDTYYFCQQKKDDNLKRVLKAMKLPNNVNTCRDIMFEIHLSHNKPATIANLITKTKPRRIKYYAKRYSKEKSQKIITDTITDWYDNYRLIVPDYLTAKIWYDPKSWNPINMITAAFAHGSWDHVIFNLFFFFAFAATVEIILRSLRFLFVVIALAIGTHVFYSLSTLGMADPAPTVGLSGVVMGMMALFTYFLPHANIRCFLWVIIIIRRLSVPAWLLAGFYIGGDIYTLFFTRESDGINLVAHVSGAGIGYFMGMLLFRERKKQLLEVL